MGPRVGGRNFVSRLKQVVLPAPFGPIRPWMVPRRTRRVTSLTATKPRNSFVSPSVSRMVSVTRNALPAQSLAPAAILRLDAARGVYGWAARPAQGRTERGAWLAPAGGWAARPPPPPA